MKKGLVVLAATSITLLALTARSKIRTSATESETGTIGDRELIHHFYSAEHEKPGALIRTRRAIGSTYTIEIFEKEITRENHLWVRRGTRVKAAEDYGNTKIEIFNKGRSCRLIHPPGSLSKNKTYHN
ncbi:hypothetical protein CMI41_01435 [Candidatus Pacearchaeota archaeon]|nr:hypothetical protein [Candidatus Pacearchaeota archaeon]|tara:strand:- start:1057 stop:1440 length:384 start_codon:yes stop_codon:yes gene_type:complete